jgi:TPR repeat protein
MVPDVGQCRGAEGLPVDYAAAAHWYWRAASYDYDWAIYNYAHLLASGRGVTQDRATAFLWFRLAATRGHARAMHFLGQYYEHGWETPIDRDAAICWYHKSAQGGDYRGQCSYASVLVERGQIEEALDWLRKAVQTATPRYLQALAATLARSSAQPIRDFAATVTLSPAD